VVGGEDTEAPTTPTLLSAIPTAATQIDLVWSTSTDNVIVSGYVLFRDSVIVATTSQTSYLDTGLTASTTYSYEVYAFDGFFKYFLYLKRNFYYHASIAGSGATNSGNFNRHEHYQYASTKINQK
jgi:hypothetical protein